MTLNNNFSRVVDRNRHVYGSFIVFEKFKKALSLFGESVNDNKTKEKDYVEF